MNVISSGSELKRICTRNGAGTPGKRDSTIPITADFCLMGKRRTIHRCIKCLHAFEEDVDEI